MKGSQINRYDTGNLLLLKYFPSIFFPNCAAVGKNIFCVIYILSTDELEFGLEFLRGKKHSPHGVKDELSTIFWK